MTGVASAGRFAASFLAYSRIFVGSSKIEVSGESLKNRQGELSEIFLSNRSLFWAWLQFEIYLFIFRMLDRFCRKLELTFKSNYFVIKLELLKIECKISNLSARVLISLSVIHC